MDEIDAIGGRRFSEGTSADREIQRTLMELLNQMDGFDRLGQVKMIMATNRPDVLDPALLRPGRLDRKIGEKLAEAHFKAYTVLYTSLFPSFFHPFPPSFTLLPTLLFSSPSSFHLSLFFPSLPLPPLSLPTISPSLLPPLLLSLSTEIPLPNEQARLDILKIHASPITKHGEIGKVPFHKMC